VDEIKGITIPRHFFLIPVFERRMPEDHCANTSLVDLHALDAVGRHNTLRNRIFPKNLEALRGLSREEILKALGTSYVGQVP